MKKLLFALICILFASSQIEVEVTAIVSNGKNRITNFEINYIQEIFNLYNKSNSTKTKLILKLSRYNSWEVAASTLELSKGNNFILCINQVTVTPSWNTVSFSKPYLPIREALIMPLNSDSISLTKNTVVITPNISTVPIPLQRLVDNYGLKLIRYKNDGEWANLLNSNKAQLLYGDNILLANNPDKLKLHSQHGPRQNLGIIYPKGSSLKAKLAPFINYFTSSPKYYQLLKKHFTPDILDLIKNELQNDKK